MNRLEKLKNDKDTEEDSLQKLIEDAPWLVNPEWAPVTANQTLSTLRTEFEKYYQRKTGETITLTDFHRPTKRPDFVLTTQEGVVQIIEIKRPAHKLTNDEMDRIVTYHQQMSAFLEDSLNEQFAKSLPGGFHIPLVCHDVALSGTHKAAYDGYLKSGDMTHINWTVFLAKTKTVHQDFLNEAERQKRLVTNRDST